MQEITLPGGEPQLLSKLLVASGLAPSNAEARRLLSQGGVKVEGNVVSDPFFTVPCTAGSGFLVQVGKRRFARLRFAPRS